MGSSKVWQCLKRYTISDVLADRLKSSRFDVPDIIDHVTHCFDETTKRLFKSLDEVSYIQFGSPAETQAGLGIQRGKMKLAGFVPLHP